MEIILHFKTVEIVQLTLVSSCNYIELQPQLEDERWQSNVARVCKKMNKNGRFCVITYREIVGNSSLAVVMVHLYSQFSNFIYFLVTTIAHKKRMQSHLRNYSNHPLPGHRQVLDSTRAGHEAQGDFLLFLKKCFCVVVVVVFVIIYFNSGDRRARCEAPERAVGPARIAQSIQVSTVAGGGGGTQ